MKHDTCITPLRLTRVLRGISQHDLATRASVSQSLVSLVERGMRVGSPSVRGRIARGLRTPVRTLFPVDRDSSERREGERGR